MKRLLLSVIIVVVYALGIHCGCTYITKAPSYGPPHVYIVQEGDCKFTLYYQGIASSIEGPSGSLKVNEVEIVIENCKIVKNELKIPVLRQSVKK